MTGYWSPEDVGAVFNESTESWEFPSPSGPSGGSVAVDDDGIEVVAEASRLNFGTNLTVTDDGDGEVTVDASTGAAAGLSDADPLPDGAAAPGVDVEASRADHVHPAADPSVQGVALDGRLSTFPLVDQAAPHSLFVNERPTVYDPASNRTYVAWQDVDRDLYVGALDHATGQFTSAKAADAVAPVDEAHSAPSLEVLDDGTLIVAWGTTGAGSNIQIVRSDAPRSVTGGWTSTSLSPATVYPNLLKLADGDLLLFSFAATGVPGVQRWAVRRSTDGGATWGAATNIIDTAGTFANPIAYVFSLTLDSDGLVRLTWTVGNTATAARNNIYHATYDPSDGTVRNAAGTSLGTTIEAADHPSCIVWTGSNAWYFKHNAVAADRVYVTFHAGTDGTGETGTYTVRVARWDGASWAVVDTGAPTVWAGAGHQVFPFLDGLLGLFATRDTGQERSDITAWYSPDETNWFPSGTLLAGDMGEGYQRVHSAGAGPILALAEQHPDGWSRDPGDGMAPLVAIVRSNSAAGPSGAGGVWGTVEIASGDTSGSVEHGQHAAELGDFQVGKNGPLGSASDWWWDLDDAAGTLDVHVDAAPGVTVPFVWSFTRRKSVLPPPPPFDPLSIPWHTVFWADQITGLADGDPVGQWDDLSGNNRHATASGTVRPAYRSAHAPLNNRPAVVGDGVNDRLITATFSAVLAQPNTAVVVGVLPNTGGAPFFAGPPAGNQALYVGGGSGSVSLFAGTNLNSGAINTSPSRRLFVGLFDGSSSQLTVDGTVRASGGAGANGIGGLSLMSYWDGTAATAAAISFVGVIGRALTSQENADLLAWAQSIYDTP